MTKICYLPHRFNAAKTAIIAQAEDIAVSYAQQGYSLTLRQLYYRFVATDAFPGDRTWSWSGSRWVRDPAGTKNAEPNYKWLGDVINDARLAGVFDWDHITDRTRNLQGWQTVADPAEAIGNAARDYLTPKWGTQPEYVEVWVEKDALADVVRRVAMRYEVPYFSCRGYTSQSELWGAAQRLYGHEDEGQPTTVIHLGDHDPSGIDMTRDIRDRLHLFGTQTEVIRIALNMDQVEQYGPPPNPAKLTDSRCQGYIAEYGDSSWELDALEPQVLDALIDAEVRAHLDEDAWDTAVAAQEEERTVLRACTAHWPAVAGWVAAEFGA